MTEYEKLEESIEGSKEIKKMITDQINVKQNPKKEIPVSVLTESIVEISHAMRVLRAARLTDRAIAVLVKDSCGVHMSTVTTVIKALENLESKYLK